MLVADGADFVVYGADSAVLPYCCPLLVVSLLILISLV